MEPEWLKLVRELQGVAQNGLMFTDGHFDRLRYTQVREAAARLMALASEGDYEQILDLFSQDQGYATPKVDVRGVVMQDEKMLLVRERSDGLWTLPGGWADPCFTPSQCVEKEIHEEAGFTAKADKLLAVYDRSQHAHPPYPFHVYKLFFQCSLLGGTLGESDETSEAGFFDEAELPPLSMGRVTPDQIARMFAHLEHPDWPTDFD